MVPDRLAFFRSTLNGDEMNLLLEYASGQLYFCQQIWMANYVIMPSKKQLFVPNCVVSVNFHDKMVSYHSVLGPFSDLRPFLYFDPPTLFWPKLSFDHFITTLRRPELYFDFFGQTLLRPKLYLDLCFSTNKKSRFDKKVEVQSSK